MSLSIKKERACLWSTCLVCVSTLAQDSKDMIWPEKIVEILQRDGGYITKW